MFMKKTDKIIAANEVNRISSGTVIFGEIISSTDIRIDGNFNGKLYVNGRAVIGEKAVIKGDIICHNADVWGKIEGNCYVKESLSVKVGGEIKGDILVKKISVDMGAVFFGKCGMLSDERFSEESSKFGTAVTAEKE